jgi:hypothetical protein
MLGTLGIHISTSTKSPLWRFIEIPTSVSIIIINRYNSMTKPLCSPPPNFFLRIFKGYKYEEKCFWCQDDTVTKLRMDSASNQILLVWLKIIASVRWSMMIKTHTYPEWMCLVDCWHGSLTRLCIPNNNMQRWQKADTHSKQRQGKCMGAIPPELGNCNNQYLCSKLLCSKAKLSMWKRSEKQLLSGALS